MVLNIKKKIRIFLGNHGFLFCHICGGKQVQLSQKTVKKYSDGTYGPDYEFPIENRECKHKVQD